MTVPAIAPLHPDRLRNLSALLLDLATQADELAEKGDLPSLAFGLNDLRDFRRQVTDLERHVEGLVADTMPKDVVNLSDEVVLERRRGKDRRAWQSETILDELFMQAHCDEDGALRTLPEIIEGFREAVRACVPLTGSLGWRTQALRSYGIDPDEYATSTPGRVSVKVSIKEDQ